MHGHRFLLSSRAAFKADASMSLLFVGGELVGGRNWVGEINNVKINVVVSALLSVTYRLPCFTSSWEFVIDSG